jgi:hypothetical protein
MKKKKARMPCACMVPVPKYPETADWGPILWTLLHGLAEKAGSAPLPADEVREWQRFLKATNDMLPCDKCRSHFSLFLKANPATALDTLPYSQLRSWIRSWFYTLHNEINVENSKPEYNLAQLALDYTQVNFQDLIWRLEPVLKRAMEPNGVSLLKWLHWKKSFQMLRAAIGV